MIIHTIISKRKQVVITLPIGQLYFNPNETVEFKSNYSQQPELSAFKDSEVGGYDADAKSKTSKIGSIFAGGKQQNKSINNIKRGNFQLQ